MAIKKGKELQAYGPPMGEATAALAKLKGGKQPAAEAEVLQVELVDLLGMN